LFNLNSDLKLNYNLAINGQFVKRKIANADKISIGGVSSVRGFNNSSISGDIGYFIRNDLTINLSDLRNEEFYKNLELGVFYDYGAVRNIGYRSGRLSSVGLTFNSKPKIIVKKFDKLQFNSQLSLAKTLTDSKLESNNNKYAVYYRLGLEI
jgi:hemolysin activation/secretion protein